MVPVVSTHRSGVARTPAQNERARGYASEFLARYKGNKTEAAAALGVSQPTFSNFLNRKTGIGNVLEPALMKAFGISRSMLLDGVEDEPHRVLDSTLPVLGSLPGAHEALARAKRQEPWFPAFAWDDAMATATLIAPAVVTPAMLVAAARLSMSVRSGEQLDEATMAQAEAEEADREARQIEAQRLVREAEARGEKLDPIKVMNDLRLRNQRAELDAAKARDAAHGTANDAPPPPSNDVAKKRGGRKG